MRKAIFAFLIAAVLLVASCSKSPTAGGTWTFQGTSYTATTCAAIGNSVNASSSTNSNTLYFSEIAVAFPDSTMPTVSGTYTVVDTTPVGKQVNVTVSTGGTSDTLFSATGGNGSNQTITLTISKGKYTVTGTGIEMLNQLVPGDSAPLSFNIYN